MSTFKDLFSGHASEYAKFRPCYPEALFQYLSTLVPERDLAWDCGAGNGQAAVALADHFASVVATDYSEKQLESAEAHPKVVYLKSPAEKAPLESQSVDLITVAQAFHWFQYDEFFKEVKRVLKPQGVLAIWCYNLCTITPDVDQLVYQLYDGTLGSYWEMNRKLVEQGYQQSPFPMREITPPEFEMHSNWSFEHLIGYLGTWSSLQTYIKKNGTNPLEELAPKLQKAWGTASTRSVHWKLSMRVGKL